MVEHVFKNRSCIEILFSLTTLACFCTRGTAAVVALLFTLSVCLYLFLHCNLSLHEFT